LTNSGGVEWNVEWSIVPSSALLTVDSSRVMLTIDAHATTFIVSIDVDTGAIPSDLIVITTIA
jgi:hypothetical protein